MRIIKEAAQWTSGQSDVLLEPIAFDDVLTTIWLRQPQRTCLSLLPIKVRVTISDLVKDRLPSTLE